MAGMPIWGVKVWRGWTVEGDSRPAALEEAVLLVRASSADEASAAALRSAQATDGTFANELGQTVTVATLGVDHVYETHESRAVSGTEVFARLYDAEDDDPPFGPPEDLWAPGTRRPPAPPAVTEAANVRDERPPRYRFRTRSRVVLPRWLALRIPKGPRDCGQHEWYRSEGSAWRCYHCSVGRLTNPPGQQDRAP